MACCESILIDAGTATSKSTSRPAYLRTGGADVEYAQYRRVILSPHLDDASLSCGGAMHRWTTADEPVLVVTLMAGGPPAAGFSPFARCQHDVWGLPPREAYARRRAEDAAATLALDADYVHLDFLDCIYRGDDGGFFYLSDQDIFGPVNPADKGMVEALVSQLALLEPLETGAAVYAPLAVGNHVDHQLVRWAAEEWRGRNLLFYEDYPYSEEMEEWGEALTTSLRPHTIPLIDEDMRAKIEGISKYQSQIGVLFGDLDRMEA